MGCNELILIAWRSIYACACVRISCNIYHIDLSQWLCDANFPPVKITPCILGFEDIFIFQSILYLLVPLITRTRNYIATSLYIGMDTSFRIVVLQLTAAILPVPNVSYLIMTQPAVSPSHFLLMQANRATLIKEKNNFGHMQTHACMS